MHAGWLRFGRSHNSVDGRTHSAGASKRCSQRRCEDRVQITLQCTYLIAALLAIHVMISCHIRVPVIIYPGFMEGRPRAVVGGMRRLRKQMFHPSSGGKETSTRAMVALDGRRICRY